jgi:hypothetical protein
MREKIQPDTVWRNVTRKQFITILHVDINENMVHYTDNSDNSRNPKVHKKKVDHILRLFEFSTAIIK